MKNKTDLHQINNSNLPGLLALTFSLTFIMLVNANAQGEKSNFSGDWVFNASKSNIGTDAAMGFPRGGTISGADFVAIQDDSILTIKTTVPDQDGKPITRELKFTLDFKPSINITPGRNGGTGTPATSYAKWSDDGKTLRIVTKTIGNGTARTTEEWTLIDSNNISITSSSVSGTGERRTEAVFVRE